MKKFLITGLIMSMLLLPWCGWPTGAAAQQQDTTASSTASSSAQISAEPQASQPTYRPSRASRRSYAREARQKRHHHITKGEIAFMAGIAGTSMGIGALAGGAKGLAIGSIVGGWGAYVGHRLWHKIRE
jgi:hypothetical protein